MPNTKSSKTKRSPLLKQMLVDHELVTIFGRICYELPTAAGLEARDFEAPSDAAINAVEVIGARILGNCIKYLKPFLFILPGPGEDIDPDVCCCWEGDKTIRQWTLAKNYSVLKLTPQAGAVIELLFDGGDDDFEAKDICVSAVVDDGKIKVKFPAPIGNVTIPLRVPVPDGTKVDVCADICQKWGLPTGAKIEASLNGQLIGRVSVGSC